MKYLIFVLLLLTPFASAQEIPAEQLVGRLLMLAFEGSEPPLEQLSEIQPAGFLFYAGNLPSTEAARRSTHTLQNHADYPLIFAVDQEGGPFSSYRPDNATLFPGNMALAAAGDLALAERVAEATGLELTYAGLTMNFSPVVDVNSNPDNPIIGIRSFGDEANAVGAFGDAWVRGLQQTGVAAVAKHFPGHGDTDVDSHLDLPIVEATRERLEQTELPPFAQLIETGVSAMMSAHVVYPALDELPATLSEPILTGLLRDTMGFEGLTVSDYMDMQAITDHYNPVEAAIMSIQAGADMLLLGPDPEVQRQVRDGLAEALTTGRLSEARVREAVARSETLAEQYPLQVEATTPDYAAHQTLAREVASAGATLLWNEGALPLAENARTLVIAPTLCTFGCSPNLGEVLAAHHPNSEQLEIKENPSQSELETALARAAQPNVEVIILGSYHWLGAFPANLITLHEQLVQLGKPVVVVSLGNPSEPRFLGEQADAYLAVYGFREANVEAAARILTGASSPQGSLPVPTGNWSVGSGMEGFE